MHFNFGFSTIQVLWTLTFAALLVLLVVLMGRDRARRFPWFTTSIVLVALRLLASKLLYGKLAPITLSTIFILLADLIMLASLLVLVELARRSFSGLRRRSWIVGSLALLAVGGAVLATWGPWPPWKTLTANSYLAVLGLLQLAEQKGILLANVLAVELGLLVVIFGRRFKAGWRTHAQQIMIGLSTVAIAQMAVQGTWQLIALKVVPKSEAEYERVLGLRDKLFSANSTLYVIVLVWWIACLWIDEPTTVAEAPAEIPATTGELSETVENTEIAPEPATEEPRIDQ